MKDKDLQQSFNELLEKMQKFTNKLYAVFKNVKNIIKTEEFTPTNNNFKKEQK
jgi:flavodoxin